MTPDALLAEFEPLTHRKRIQRMVDLGRSIARGDDPALAPLADALERHESAYARLLAVGTAWGSHDGARVLRALRDPSRAVRGRAIKLVPLACDDAQAEAALGLVPSGRLRTRLAVALRRRRRSGVLDAFLDARLGEARPEGQVVDLLAIGSADAVARHAAAFREHGGPLAWQRIAKWQPAAAVAVITAALDGHGPIDPRLRWHLGLALGLVPRAAPDAALQIARLLFARGVEPADALVRGVLAILARRRPAETFDLLRARHESGGPSTPPGAFGVVRFDRAAHRLGVERLSWLVRHAWSALPDGDRGRRWFLRLSEEDRATLLGVWTREGRGAWGGFLLCHIPADGPVARAREAGFERWVLGASSSEGVITLKLLEHLPLDLRVREARRHLQDVPALATKPEQRLRYAELLPFAEARSALASHLGHPEGEQRAAAQRILLASLRFDRSAVPEGLAQAHARRFEQDPVRRAMLEALAGLPRRCFGVGHLEAVGVLVQDALDTADLSAATAGAAEQIVVRLFRLDAAWGARWLTKILAARGSLSSPGLGEELTEPETCSLAPVLAELASAWLTRERAGALIWLAAGLGRRLAVVAAVLDALESFAAELPFVGVAGAALDLLRRHAPRRFASLVPRLLAADPSFAILVSVARFVSRTRQDLLDPLLGDAPMTGRFATGKTRWAIDFGGGYVRWTARQQRVYGAGLAAVAADPQRDLPAIRATVQTLARLAFAPADASISLASDRRPPVREIAVRALPWLDGGQGIGVLIECLGDDRARWAIYALRKAFREMDRAGVLAVLRGAPTGKVTVAKEIVRLLGEMGGDDAFGELVALDAPGLHRDIRVALLRALWDHLERPEAWAVFERAAADPDWVLASRLADIPSGRLSTAAEARLCRLLVRVLARPEVEARIDLLRRVASIPLRDGERVLFGACLAQMAGPHSDECRTATAAALTRMLPGEADALAERVRALLPKRRLLEPMVSEVGCRLGPYAPAQLRRVAEGVLAALAADQLGRAAAPRLRAPRARVEGAGRRARLACRARFAARGRHGGGARRRTWDAPPRAHRGRARPVTRCAPAPPRRSRARFGGRGPAAAGPRTWRARLDDTALTRRRSSEAPRPSCFPPE